MDGGGTMSGKGYPGCGRCESVEAFNKWMIEKYDLQGSSLSGLGFFKLYHVDMRCYEFLADRLQSALNKAEERESELFEWAKKAKWMADPKGKTQHFADLEFTKTAQRTTKGDTE